MKSKLKCRRCSNKYRYGFVSILLGIVCIMVCFHLYLAHMIIQQHITMIGIATEYMDTSEWNTFMNQVVSQEHSTFYQIGESALTQGGYQSSTYMLFLQPYLIGSVIVMALLLGLLSLFVFLYFRQKEERAQEVHKVAEWINSEATVLENRDGIRYVPVEFIEAIEVEKEKSVQQYMIQEENAESMMKYMENISHQLKTPLAVIRTTCERVSMVHPTVEEKMLICLGQIDKASVLIRDFLQLGRFDCKKQKLKYEYIRAADLIETVVNDLEVVAQKRNLSICIQKKEEIKWYCDSFWMEEILGNLLKNCIEHSENGEINLSYEDSNGMNQVVIRDCGAGLKEGLETTIFERYSSVKPKNVEGSGLGLSIAQEAIKLHFGTIKARNHSQGGIEFRISFPQLDATHIY